MLEVSEPTIDTRFRVFPDGASVHEYDVCLIKVNGLHKTSGRHNARYYLAIGHVHLATIGFDVEILMFSNRPCIHSIEI
jgi:hypothetical protein